MGGASSSPETAKAETPSAGDKTLPKVCRAFNKDGCNDEKCGELHICFFFVSDKCRFEDRCIKTHLLATGHNRVVLKENGWCDDDEKILQMLRDKFQPATSKDHDLKSLKVCLAYNCMKCREDDCRCLHLCLNHVLNNCLVGAACPLQHDITNGEHNLRVLRNEKLLDVQTKTVMDSLRETYLAMSEGITTPQHQKNPEQSAVKNKTASSEPMAAEGGKRRPATPNVCHAYSTKGCSASDCPYLHVCYHFVRGRCKYKMNCRKAHTIGQEEHNVAILRKFDLLQHRQSDILAWMRESYEARDARAERGEGGSRESCQRGADWPAGRVRAAPTSLVCPICCELFVKATTLGCTHTFCEDCVQRSAREADRCPLCRASIGSAVRSLVVDDAVEEWVDGLDVAGQLARRQVVAERRGGARSLPPAAARSESDGGRPSKVVTTVTTYI